MVYEDTNLYAWQWLTAEGIRYEQRKEMEIHSALDDDDTMGVRAFTALKICSSNSVIRVFSSSSTSSRASRDSHQRMNRQHSTAFGT